jgi:hypothetical protein
MTDDRDTPELAQVPISLAGGMRFSLWCKAIGICVKTGTRWRDAGKLQVVTRYGIQFVTAETIQKFFTDDGGPSGARGIAAIKARARQERLAVAATE